MKDLEKTEEPIQKVQESPTENSLLIANSENGLDANDTIEDENTPPIIENETKVVTQDKDKKKAGKNTTQKPTTKRNAITVNFTKEEWEHLEPLLAEHLKNGTAENNGYLVKKMIDFCINYNYAVSQTPNKKFLQFPTPENYIPKLLSKSFYNGFLKAIPQL